MKDFITSAGKRCGNVVKLGYFYYLVESGGVFLLLTEENVSKLPNEKQIEVRESIKILKGKEVKAGS